MKQTQLVLKYSNLFELLLILSSLLIMSSCADRRVASIPDSRLPPDHLPEIGTSSTSAPDIAPEAISRPKAVDVMISKAKKELRRGEPVVAFQTLERALSIDGQDPMVWHLMAKARLMQGEFSQAESLAKKSNTLAGTTQRLKKKNWSLIADALEKQGYLQEAEAARQK